jgi:hypothetical protein
MPRFVHKVGKYTAIWANSELIMNNMPIFYMDRVKHLLKRKKTARFTPPYGSEKSYNYVKLKRN